LKKIAGYAAANWPGVTPTARLKVREVRLVSEPTRRRNPGDRLACTEHRPSAGDPQVDLERVWRQSRLVTKAPHEFKARQTGNRGQRRQSNALVPVLGQVSACSADSCVFGLASRGCWPRTQVGVQSLDSRRDGFVELKPDHLSAQRRMHAQQRVAKSWITKHDPAGRPGRGGVQFLPLVQQRRVEIKDLVCPAFGHGGHPGMDRLRLEYE